VFCEVKYENKIEEIESIIDKSVAKLTIQSNSSELLNASILEADIEISKIKSITISQPIFQ
jgi:hypothetical protein